MIRCVCGDNEARYINELGELCCGLCPIKQGLDSIKIADVGLLLKWARRLFIPENNVRQQLIEIIGRKPKVPG